MKEGILPSGVKKKKRPLPSPPRNAGSTWTERGK